MVFYRKAWLLVLCILKIAEIISPPYILHFPSGQQSPKLVGPQKYLLLSIFLYYSPANDWQDRKVDGANGREQM